MSCGLLPLSPLNSNCEEEEIDVDALTKTCRVCSEEKPLAVFSPTKNTSDGAAAWCKACTSEKARVWRLANQDRHDAAQVQRKYGLTPSDHEKLREACGNRCEICGSDEKLGVDHCHDSDRVRGLLCAHCNNLLGRAKDSVFVLESAIRYLTKGFPDVAKAPPLGRNGPRRGSKHTDRAKAIRGPRRRRD